MREEEIIELYDEHTFNEFKKWLRGQTVGINDDGSTNYYKWDFDRFIDQYNSNFRL